MAARDGIMADYKLLIDGALVNGEAVLGISNPANEACFAQSPIASEAQAGAAVSAAKNAFTSWSHESYAKRTARVGKLADAIEARADDIARLLVQEQGKPLGEAAMETGAVPAFMRYLTQLDLDAAVLDDSDARKVELHRRPLGVVACIAPWNFPLLTGWAKVAFALASGNTVVLKPAPTTPLTSLMIGALAGDIFPAGVINVITDNNDLGDYLTTHPDVAKISFTGSTVTGRKVMASAASGIKRITLELGGNDAAVVLPDVDVKAVAQQLFGCAMLNAGQVCIAVKRIYAHEDIYDELCDELAALAESAIVDDGLKQGTQIGPLQNRAQFDKVLGFIEDARRDGTVIAGGDAIDRTGLFIRPTIVRDIPADHRLVREEQFGPVLPVVCFNDLNVALELVNGTEYGLGGSIWSADKARAYDLAKQVNSGTVWINKHLDFGPDIPVAGAKQSGLGAEFAQEGLNEFTQVQIINAAA